MTSRRLTHRQVLVDWEQFAIKKLLNLERVMPGLVQRGVVTNKTGRRILKHDDADVLLSILKQKSGDDSVYCMMFSQFSESCIRWDEKLMQALALEVWQRSKKFIGRYIGVSEADINAAIHDNLSMAKSEHLRHTAVLNEATT